jgi:hypothetical protein
MKQKESPPSVQFPVYLEIGEKRSFAGALDWPGWCRSARNEESALHALFEYADRYAQAIREANLGFRAPPTAVAFDVVERLKGNATTDFGAPGIAPSSDANPVNDVDLKRFVDLLKACWETFDSAVRAAEGKALHLGPRGGGRDLPEIVKHVSDGDAAYLSRIGFKLLGDTSVRQNEGLVRCRQAIMEALTGAPRRATSEVSPHGGVRWTHRYFVRRVAWHVLDHAWEIEDRIP